MLMSATDAVVIREHVQPSDVSTADDKHVHDAGGEGDEEVGVTSPEDLPSKNEVALFCYLVRKVSSPTNS
jgi:hypothetical protein